MLAKKFASLYFLLEDLLSPQKHYDWGLRAIKSVLVVAGSLLRAEEGQVESHVLFRALRDFNVPKILAEVWRRNCCRDCPTMLRLCSGCAACTDCAVASNRNVPAPGAQCTPAYNLAAYDKLVFVLSLSFSCQFQSQAAAC